MTNQTDAAFGPLGKAAEAMLSEVEAFNRQILGVPIPALPTPLSDARLRARLAHMREELDELEAPPGQSPASRLAEQADALVDLIYVAMGALLEMGVTPGPAFAAVHDANMRKVRGDVAKRPDSVGHDAVKPEGWSPPDMVMACLSVTPDIARNLSPAFLHAALIRAERGRTYNQGSVRLEDYFPLGDASYYQMVHLKLLRARSIMGGAEGSLEDSLVDLLNYGAFWYERCVKEGT